MVACSERGDKGKMVRVCAYMVQHMPSSLTGGRNMATLGQSAQGGTLGVVAGAVGADGGALGPTDGWAPEDAGDGAGDGAEDGARE